MNRDANGKRDLVRTRDLLALTYLYPVRGLARLIPPGALFRLAERRGPSLAGRLGSVTTQIERQMRSAFGPIEPPRGFEEMARRHVALDVRRKADDLAMHRLDTASLDRNTRIEGREHLESALADGNGVIVVSAHFLATRVAKHYLARIGYPMMSTRKHQLESPLWSRAGLRFVAPASNRFLAGLIGDEVQLPDPGLGAKMLRRLRENGLVNFHADAWSARESFVFPMLSWRHEYPAGYLRLAEKTGSPVVPMRCTGNSSDLRIRFYPPRRYGGRANEDTLRESVREYAGLVESWVREYPEEWDHWRGFTRAGPKPEA